jgi:hypothetical protein
MVIFKWYEWDIDMDLTEDQRLENPDNTGIKTPIFGN